MYQQWCFATTKYQEYQLIGSEYMWSNKDTRINNSNSNLDPKYKRRTINHLITFPQRNRIIVGIKTKFWLGFIITCTNLQCMQNLFLMWDSLYINPMISLLIVLLSIFYPIIFNNRIYWLHQVQNEDLILLFEFSIIMVLSLNKLPFIGSIFLPIINFWWVLWWEFHLKF